MFTGKAIGGEWGFFIATIIVLRLIAGRHQARRFIVTGFIVRVIVCGDQIRYIIVTVTVT